MVSFSTTNFDLNGQVILQRTRTSDVYNRSRRVSATKTLDLGISLQDSGYTDADRRFKIVSQRISRADHEAVQYLQENYPLVMVSIPEGLFLGVIENTDIRSGDLIINFFVKEKLTEG